MTYKMIADIPPMMGFINPPFHPHQAARLGKRASLARACLLAGTKYQTSFPAGGQVDACATG